MHSNFNFSLFCKQTEVCTPVIMNIRILMIVSVLSLYAFSASGVDLEKVVQTLEAAGDFETAEPIAFKLTQQKKEHYYRIAFLNQYPTSEFAEIVYMQTWISGDSLLIINQSFKSVVLLLRFLHLLWYAMFRKALRIILTKSLINE